MTISPSLPFQIPSDDPIPSLINGYFSVRGSRSVFGGPPARKSFQFESTNAFHGKKADRDRVSRTLDREGFTIIAESPLGFAVSGPPAAYEAMTGARVTAVERLTRAEGGHIRYMTHLDLEGRSQPRELGVGLPASKNLKVDGILLERPKVLMAVFPSPIPLNSPRFHLRVPGDVATALSATECHRNGLIGQDVKVVMPDSGWYRHPFFTANHYQVATPITVVPGVSTNGDPIGHGTGESANVFAIAPGAKLQPIRASNDAGDLIGAMAGFMKGKELAPQVITCSWGGDSDYPPDNPPSDADNAMALEIQHAVESGIVVVFSAGNGQFSIEPQVPGVLAAGGAHSTVGLAITASDYASGYESPWYPGTIVPTLCGLVGLLPRAQYLMLPVPPGCELDVKESKPDASDPESDGTSSSDGWALFSGTSAAAPQLAGAVAVLLAANPKLTPAQVIESLAKTAIDVTSGHCHPRFNNSATVGVDKATGFGLANVAAAVAYSKLKFPVT